MKARRFSVIGAKTHFGGQDYKKVYDFPIHSPKIENHWLARSEKRKTTYKIEVKKLFWAPAFLSPLA